MSPIVLLPLKLDVAALADFLVACPYWNENKQRTNDDQSPHRFVDDIWAHFVPVDQLGKSTAMVWYHEDLKAIANPVVQRVYQFVQGEALGGVLITRIPAGESVLPHIDRGWHAETFSKYCVCVKANREQAFCFEGAELRTASGECFFFDNSYSHHVLNPSKENRISMIVCIRTVRGIHIP